MVKGSQQGFNGFGLDRMVEGRKSVKQQYRATEDAAAENMDGRSVQHRKGNQQGNGHHTEKDSDEVGNLLTNLSRTVCFHSTFPGIESELLFVDYFPNII